MSAPLDEAVAWFKVGQSVCVHGLGFGTVVEVKKTDRYGGPVRAEGHREYTVAMSTERCSCCGTPKPARKERVMAMHMSRAGAT